MDWWAVAIEADEDPEISAAFSSTPLTAPPTAPFDDDPEIKAAFKDASASEPAAPAATPSKPSSWDALEPWAKPAHRSLSQIGSDVTELADASASAVSHAVAPIVAGAGGSIARLFNQDPEPVHQWVDQHQYHARTRGGKAAERNASGMLGKVFKPIGERIEAGYRGIGAHAGPGAEHFARNMMGAASDLTAAIPAAPPIGRFVGAIRKGAAPLGAAAETASTMSDPESISAARASADLSKASPELQQKVAEAKAAGTPIKDKKALENHVRAESLLVPVFLTRGMATEDGGLISEELNARNQTPEMRERIAHNEAALPANLTALRDKVGPEAFTDNPHDHGQALIKAYKEKDAPILQEAEQAYDEFRAAAKQFPGGAIDAQMLYERASQALHDDFVFDDAEKGIPALSTLKRLSEKGEMTPENFESMRTNLSRIQRTSADGNLRHAAGVIREQMEQLPLKGAAAALKPMADRARSLWKARKDAHEADPAYKAAVEDSVPPDKFTSTFITGNTGKASVAQVAKMKENLAGNPSALQTMSVAALDELTPYRGQAFSQAAYNRTLESLSPKLPHLFSPEDIGTLEDLGETARLAQQRPKSGQTYVSRSEPMMAAEAKEHVANVAASVVNIKTGGVVPQAWIKRMLHNPEKKAAEASQRAVRRSLEPGAGIYE